MRNSKIGKFALISMLLVLLVSATSGLVSKTSALPANAMWLDPSSITLDTTVITVGYMFNVTAWVNLTQNSFTWETYLNFNATYFNCTRVRLTGANGLESDWASHRTGGTNFPVSPVINNVAGHIDAGESCLGVDYVPGPVTASLIWIEFNVTNLPPMDHLTVNFSVPDNSFVLDPDLARLTLNNVGGTDFPVIPEFANVALLLGVMVASATSAILMKKKLKL